MENLLASGFQLGVPEKWRLDFQRLENLELNLKVLQEKNPSV
jgi:hypothetical protein